MTSPRKTPPPMYAVWNETRMYFEGPADSSKRIAIGLLNECENKFPKFKFRIVTLIESPADGEKT